MLEGLLTRGARAAYLLDAQAGQKLSVSIKAPAESAVFRIYAPGTGNAPRGPALQGAGEADDARAWNGTLAAGGRHVVEVVAPGGSASYRLSITLR